MLKTIQALLATSLICGALLFNPAIASEPVDINTASAQELALNLNGIGSSKAAAIIAYREENGGFRHIDDLVNVKGIGLTTIEKNRELILVSASDQE